jgi:hypothetical protein
MSQPRRERARKAAPCVQTRQRKPSSFGSKVKPRPWGIVPDRASIGSGSRRATRPERILLVGARQAIASGLTVPVGVSGVSRSLEDAAVLGLRALPLGRCIAVNVGRLVFKWARWHLAGAVARPEEYCGYFLEPKAPAGLKHPALRRGARPLQVFTSAWMGRSRKLGLFLGLEFELQPPQRAGQLFLEGESTESFERSAQKRARLAASPPLTEEGGGPGGAGPPSLAQPAL